MNMRFRYVLAATPFTLTAMAVAAAGAMDRGVTSIDKGLYVAIALAMIAGVHFLPMLSRHPISWVLWIGCLICAIFGHICFFENANLRAGEVRAQHSVPVVGTARQIEATRSELSGIISRPVAVIASELASTPDWRKRSALKTELSEARRAARLQDDLVRLTATAAKLEVSGATDPVTSGIAAVTGIAGEKITLLISLVFSILVELVGAFLWYQVFLQREGGSHMETSLSSYQDILANVKTEVRGGRLKPTVQAIRKFLRCSQATAMQLRRDLNHENEGGMQKA